MQKSWSILSWGQGTTPGLGWGDGPYFGFYKVGRCGFTYQDPQVHNYKVVKKLSNHLFCDRFYPRKLVLLSSVNSFLVQIFKLSGDHCQIIA